MSMLEKALKIFEKRKRKTMKYFLGSAIHPTVTIARIHGETSTHVQTANAFERGTCRVD